MFLEDHEIDFPAPRYAPPRRRFVHRFADQSVRLSLDAAFESPACFFQIDHHRDHAQIETRGGFARLPHDAFSCPLFNSLRNLGDIEQSGIISHGLQFAAMHGAQASTGSRAKNFFAIFTVCALEYRVGCSMFLPLLCASWMTSRYRSRRCPFFHP